ncbi:MFS transporter [Vibrio sp. S4M6]|uniref:MFS transporter n=1 Tax=Vibrio sinus TaxID=2946865 RepID=UPI00202A63A2|nr:MFS transporter [Vibrio sinus]MCL9781938.1 MFS transporter [Vibrio sinus]
MVGNKRINSNFRRVVVALLFLVTIINYIDRASISFAFNELHTSKSEIGLILGGFGIGYLITTFVGGILVDRFGPKTVLVVSAIFWAIAMFTTALTSSFAMLFASRILLGLAEGPNFPTMAKTMSNWLPHAERGRSLSYGLLAVPISLAIGSPLIAELTVHYTWRGMFFILGAVVLVWVPFWLKLFKNTPEESKHVSQNELSVINKDISENQKDLDGSEVSWRYMLTNPTLLSNYWAFFVFGYFLFFFMGWLPNYLHTTYHLNIKQEGFFSIAPWAFGAIFMWGVGYFSDFLMIKTKRLRLARSYPIIISQLLASLCIIPLVLIHHPSLMMAAILISLAVGFSMSANANYTAINIDVAKKRAGTATGIMEACFAVSGIVAPIITGYLVQFTGTFKSGLFLLVAFGLSSVILSLLFHRPDNSIKQSYQSNLNQI